MPALSPCKYYGRFRRANAWRRMLSSSTLDHGRTTYTFANFFSHGLGSSLSFITTNEADIAELIIANAYISTHISTSCRNLLQAPSSS
jgi:hypothetical protein